MSQLPVAVALLAVAAATLLAGAARRWLFHWTSVTSHSMAPTLRPGQRRLTLPARSIGALVRGDIVVLRSRELDTDVIKRVVGLPGDRVHIARDGTVEVNGTPLVEPHVAFPGGPAGRFHVPPDRILVLGDNRAASSDSRRWRDPYVPEKALRGRLLRPRGRRRTAPALNVRRTPPSANRTHAGPPTVGAPLEATPHWAPWLRNTGLRLGPRRAGAER